MFRRGFNGADDLAEMQRLVAARTQAMGRCTNLHPADISHRIYSGLRGRDLLELVPVWQMGGVIAAFGIVWPDDHSFDVVTRFGLDGHTVSEIVENLADLAGGGALVGTDVIGDDRQLTVLLTDIGFVARSAEYVITEASLDMLTPVGPHAFTIRPVTVDDTEQLAAVHSGAFGGGWSSANYRERMRSPGYDPDDEIVAVGPTGTFMGFAVTGCDDLNSVGNFGPVGVHRSFHRHAVGSALLSEGKQRMRRAGMETVTAWHAAEDQGAAAFYRSNGFMFVNPVTRWVRARSGPELVDPHHLVVGTPTTPVQLQDARLDNDAEGGVASPHRGGDSP